MQEYTCKIDTTSKRIAVFIQDSSKADGSGLAGLVFNSSGLSCYYWRENEGNAAATAVTLATATRGTWTSSGFIEKDATNMPGWYEFGVPNAAVATGAKWVEIAFRGAANMALTPVRIHLVNYDPFDTVRLGLTALPNAAADGAGGLPISDAGGLDMDAIKTKTDLIPASPAATGASMALTAAAVDAVLDEVVEGTYTMRQLLRLFAAALGGELSGAATTAIAIRDISDTKTRITATVDANGNRSAVTFDLT